MRWIFHRRIANCSGNTDESCVWNSRKPPRAVSPCAIILIQILRRVDAATVQAKSEGLKGEPFRRRIEEIAKITRRAKLAYTAELEGIALGHKGDELMAYVCEKAGLPPDMDEGNYRRTLRHGKQLIAGKETPKKKKPSP